VILAFPAVNGTRPDNYRAANGFDRVSESANSCGNPFVAVPVLTEVIFSFFPSRGKAAVINAASRATVRNIRFRPSFGSLHIKLFQRLRPPLAS
jgi:hypothetical protein